MRPSFFNGHVFLSVGPGAVFTKLFVRKFVRTKSYEVRKKVRKCDSPNFLTKFVKIRCVSGRERYKPISRNYTTHAAANGKSFYTEREKARIAVLKLVRTIIIAVASGCKECR